MTSVKVTTNGVCSCLYKVALLTWKITVVLRRSLWPGLTPQVDTSLLGRPMVPSWSSTAGQKLFVVFILELSTL
jgi:hypothetical protein